MFDPESPAQAERFGRLPLLPVIVVKGSRCPELPEASVRPRLRIEYESLVGIEAMAVGIHTQEGLAL